MSVYAAVEGSRSGLAGKAGRLTYETKSTLLRQLSRLALKPALDVVTGRELDDLLNLVLGEETIGAEELREGGRLDGIFSASARSGVPDGALRCARGQSSKSESQFSRATRHTPPRSLKPKATHKEQVRRLLKPVGRNIRDCAQSTHAVDRVEREGLRELVRRLGEGCLEREVLFRRRACWWASCTGMNGRHAHADSSRRPYS